MSDIAINLELLERAPDAVFAQLRANTPIAWIEPFGMWYVTRYADVKAILNDNETFAVGTDASLLKQTFGEHMLTVDGARHNHLRGAFRGAFAPRAIADGMTMAVDRIVHELIDGFVSTGLIEFRQAFAARLPVLVMLDFFGLDRDEEVNLRRWYDDFEAALSNFARDPAIEARAAVSVEAFHACISRRIVRLRSHPGQDPLSQALCDTRDGGLSDEELCRNAAIIFFGGISTVEALILNCLYALDCHPDVRRAQPTDDAVIEEVMRWASPVQSATRHVMRETTWHGVTLKPGDTVNCMLGAANRDPAVFVDSERFDPARSDVKRHLGFALGSHFCLGSHLARLEARATLAAIAQRMPAWRIAEPTAPEGIEFRQPPKMLLQWA